MESTSLFSLCSTHSHTHTQHINQNFNVQTEECQCAQKFLIKLWMTDNVKSERRMKKGDNFSNITSLNVYDGKIEMKWRNARNWKNMKRKRERTFDDIVFYYVLLLWVVYISTFCRILQKCRHNGDTMNNSELIAQLFHTVNGMYGAQRHGSQARTHTWAPNACTKYT